MAAHDKHAHHEGFIRLVREDGVDFADHSPQQKGAVAHWEDGTTSYLLHTRSGPVHGYALADDADSVIQFVDALRAGEDLTPDQVSEALVSIRRSRLRLEAIENEAILCAREKTKRSGATGRDRSRLSFEDIADAVGLDHSTVVERYGRMRKGLHAFWRTWLVQGTPRVRHYAGN